jgi:predicted CxxxxCH...CXXCH cytochrome family protein
VAAATHVNGATTQTTFGCSQCHGVLSTASPGVVSGAVNAAPGAAGTGVNTTGAAIAATTPQYGAHRAHLEQSAYGAALPCASCHAVPAAGNTSHATGAGTGGALATLTWSTLASGTVDPWSSGTPAAPSYTRAAGCASTYCHGQFRNGQTGKTLVWAQDITLTCNSCHGTAGPNPATPPGGSHPANSTCATCHTGYTGTTVNLTTHMNGRLEAAGGDCTGCHNSAQGTRRAIVPEFAGAWSHKRSAAGAVTKFDCAVCHMEGDPTTGDTTAAHQGTPGGNINLRDPDLGTEILGVTWGGTGAGTYTSTASPVAFTRFSRNLGSATLEPAVQAIMINQCLKCHDANGANSPLARVPTTGTAAKPFGTTIAGAGYTGAGVTALGTLGGVTDVSASFAATNSSYHPVRGKQNNSYVGNARMYAPWNALSPAKVAATTTSYGYLISCWDCHAPVAATGVQTSTVTAHGGAATLRRSVWVQSTTDNLCIVCHNTTAGSNDHGAGSAWASGGNSTPGSRARDACYFCHSSSIAKPARPIPAQDAHGFNAFAPAAGTDTMWPVGATNTYRPYGFMRSIAATGGRWSGTSWRPSRTPELTSGSATCGGSGSLGTGCGSENHGTYTPGGVY